MLSGEGKKPILFCTAQTIVVSLFHLIVLTEKLSWEINIFMSTFRFIVFDFNLVDEFEFYG